MAELSLASAVGNEAQARQTQTAHAVDVRSPRPKRGLRLHSSLASSPTPGTDAATITSAAREVGKNMGDVTLNRAKMVHGATTGEPVEFTHWWGPTKDRVTEQLGSNVTIEKGDVQAAFTFLDSMVKDWADEAKKPAPAMSSAPNMLEHLLQNPLNEDMSNVMQLLSRSEVGADGERFVTADAQKIKDFLQNEDNWATTLMLMEQSALMKQLVLGATGHWRKQFYNRQTQEGPTGKSIHDQIHTLPSLAKSLISNVTAGGEALAYLLAGTGNAKFVYKTEADLLQAVQNLPAERRAYFKAWTGVDVAQLFGNVTNATEGYAVLTGSLKRSISGIYEVRERIIDQISGRESVTTRRWRIDRGSRIRTPEDHIFNDDRAPGRNPDPEENELRYFREYMDEYVTIPRNSRIDRAFASLVARRKVICRFTKRNIDLERAQEAHKKDKGAFDAMKAKLTAIDSNPGQFRAEEVKKHQEAKSKADAKVEAAKQRKSELKDGPDSALKKDQILLTQEAALIREFGLDISKSVDQALQDKIVDLRTEANNARDDYRDKVKDKADEVKTFTVDEILKPLRDIQDEYVKSIPKLPAGAKASAPTFDVAAISQPGMDAINAKYDTDIAYLDAEYKAAEARVRDLEAKQKQYLTTLSEVDAATREIIAKEPGQMERSGDAIQLFVAPGGIFPGNPDMVKDTSVEDLMEELRLAGVGGTTDAERLEVALQAKAAEAADRQAALPIYQQDAIDILVVAGITPDEILTLKRTEIAKRVAAYYVPPLTVYTPDEISEFIEDSYNGGSRYLRALVEAQADQEIAYYEGVSNAEQKEIDSLSDLKEKRADLRVAIGVMGGMLSKGEDNTYSRIRGLVNDTATLELLADDNPIAATDMTFSQAEKNSGLSAGAVRWLREFLPESVTSATDRDLLFEALTRTLPEDKLYEFLNDSLNLGLGAPITYPALAVVLRARIAAGNRFTPPQLQLLTKTVGNHMREVGLAV